MNISDILDLRKSKKLHTVVEERLEELISKHFSDTKPVSEVSAVLGGRNDLVQYFFNSRKVVFEIFCSASQVPQDLRLLEQCDANIKIAIFLDANIDEKVSTQYFRKKPDVFPFLWLKGILDEKYEDIIAARLHEIIDENDSIKKLRNLLSTSYRDDIERVVNNSLDKIEKTLQKNIIDNKVVYSGKEIISFMILKKFLNKGIPISKLRALNKWLLGSIEHAVMVIQAGFKAYLITDLDGRNAIWSAGDLIDDLIVLDDETKNSVQIILCLNPIINGFFEKSGMKPAKEKYHVYHSYDEYIKEVITIFNNKNK